MNDSIHPDLIFRIFIAWIIISALSFVFGKRFSLLGKTMLLNIVFRFAIVWLALSMLFFAFTKQFVDLFLPYMTFVVNLIQDDYKATLNLAGKNDELIQLTAILNRDVAQLQPGVSILTFIDSLQFIMAQALLFSILLAWPVRHFHSRLKLLSLGLPLALVLAGVTTPMLLAGVNETTFQRLGSAYNEPNQHQWLLNWMWFIENVGDWSKSVVLAILGGTILQRTWMPHLGSRNG